MANLENLAPSKSNPQTIELESRTSKTKVTGYLIFTIAILNTLLDAVNGNGFDYKYHLNDIYTAAGGLGLVFLRKAVDKVQFVITELLDKVNKLSK